MDIHEFQAKEFLKSCAIEVGDFYVAKSQNELSDLVESLPFSKAVIKAQVHAGGRGKAGGVKIANGKADILEKAKQMLGRDLVTKQTGTRGKPINEVLIAPLAEIKKEFYFAMTVDRLKGQVCLMLSAAGGVDIEDLAENHPEAIYKIFITSPKDLRKDHLWNMALHLGLKEPQSFKSAFALFPKLVNAFFSSDASLLEINPLILDNKDELFCLDARMSIDDNALFRQKELSEFNDSRQRSAQEAESEAHDLSYIALDGSIGCMVNGAGLAMATMDIINYYGGRPANFLDVGGSATEEKIAAGFEILVSDANVTAILVNIFGGIMSCATIAKGVLGALRKKPLSIPLIVRLEGTSVDEGRELIASSDYKNIFTADNLGHAAQLAVEHAAVKAR